MPLWILVGAISTQKCMNQGHSSSTFYCSNQGVPKLVQHRNFHLKLISELSFLFKKHTGKFLIFIGLLYLECLLHRMTLVSLSGQKNIISNYSFSSNLIDNVQKTFLLPRVTTLKASFEPPISPFIHNGISSGS